MTVRHDSGTEWVPPPSFDGYRLIKPLGSGGMGRVYLGHDLLLDRAVALKFMSRADADLRHRKRFEREGQVLARLSHPNVVLTFRVGRVEGHPFLVSEFVAGQSLDQIPRPVHWRQALDIGIGLARGLAAVHRAGILHRDIKPQNVMLTPQQEIKLIDFGVAAFLARDAPPEEAHRPAMPGPPACEATVGDTVSDDADDEPAADVLRLSHTGALIGTRRYMSPERLRGEPATRQSDIFALGRVLQELCTEAQPAPEVDEQFRRIVDRCVEPEASRRYDAVEDLLAALEVLADESTPYVGAVPRGNPYRGLEAFDADYCGLFVGRSREIAAVVERLRTEQVVVVAGDSGVGKSSLCKAGVLPRIAEAGLLNGRRCRIIQLTPGREPMSRLATALAQLLNQGALGIRERLISEPMEILRAIGSASGESTTLIFVDQIEETFTLAPAEEAAAFTSVLAVLASSGNQLRVLVTVRGDFLARLASAPGLGPHVARAPYLLRPLAPDKLREVIVVPARRSGVSFATHATVDELVRATLSSDSALPLLQFALAELWDARDRGANQIQADSLARLGGLEGALESHAERLLKALPAGQLDSAKRLLLRLVTGQRTRASLSREEVRALSPQDQATLEGLIAGRLVVVRGSEDLAVYELAHEALIARWTTLRTWLDEAMVRKNALDRLTAAVREWERLGRRPEALWRGRQLADALGLDLNECGPAERTFLQIARAVRRRDRLLKASLPIALIASVLFAVAGVHMRARAEIRATVARSRAVASQFEAEALRLDRDSCRLRQEALARFDDGAGLLPGGAHENSWKEAENLWARVTDESRAAESAYARATSILDTALFVDPSATQIREDLVRLLTRRRTLADRAYRHELYAELTSRLNALRQAGGNHDVDGADAPATLRVLAGAGARIQAGRYEPDDTGRLALRPLGAVGDSEQRIPAGSYLISVQFSDCGPLRLPILLHDGQRTELSLPTAADCHRVPDGFALIPGGLSLTGSDDETLRAALDGAPLHEISLPSFLIGRHEVTVGEYARWLDSLPREARLRRTPKSHTDPSSVELAFLGDGHWTLTLRPLLHTYVVRWGEPLRYPGRTVHAVQDWRRFPVTGISFNDAVAYARWLGATRQLKGARVCRDVEWEKAARGADGRIYTTGRKLRPVDANFAPTHGGTDLALGPDEVGSHPRSASPYGVDDVHGNAYEMVTSARWNEQAGILGGSWDREHVQQRLDDRFRQEPNSRNAQFGFRICADFSH